ncbi:MAG: hypothetical protein FAZ92_04054 [Accumulibacter sp.]|nr:MAG: hypothetical protein FAZ92_04054 [Accumulibacter sp.]
MLCTLVARFGSQAGLDATAQDDHPSCRTPAGQAEFAFDSVKALAHTLPLALPPEPLDQTFDAGGLPELEEVGLVNLFHGGHYTLVAKSVVPAYQGGTFLGREPINQQAQTGQAMFGGRALPALHFDVEHKANVADPVGMQGMAWPSRFCRVVADFGTRLVAVEQLDTGVGVKNPGGVQGFARAFGQGCVHPGGALCQLSRAGRAVFVAAALGLLGSQMRQRAAQAFVADDLAHAEDLWRDGIATQPGHVCIAPLAIQYREQPGAENVDHRRRVGAGIGRRAAFLPASEQSGNLEEFGKERQLSQSRGAAAFVPANVKSATRRRHAHLRHRLGRFLQRTIHRFGERFLLKIHFTHRVTTLIGRKPSSALSLYHFSRVQLRKIGSSLTG